MIIPLVMKKQLEVEQTRALSGEKTIENIEVIKF